MNSNVDLGRTPEDGAAQPAWIWPPGFGRPDLPPSVSPGLPL